MRKRQGYKTWEEGQGEMSQLGFQRRADNQGYGNGFLEQTRAGGQEFLAYPVLNSDRILSRKRAVLILFSKVGGQVPCGLLHLQK